VSESSAPVSGVPAETASPASREATVPPDASGETTTGAASDATGDPTSHDSAPVGLPASTSPSFGSSAASPTAGESERAAQAQRAAESEALAEQGIQFCRSAQWRAAIEPLRRATELDPTNVAAFYYLGDAYNHADTLPAALEAFESAARLQPEHWRALKGVGIVLDRMRRPQEATAAYQRAREAQSKGDTR
jgi:Flp pilus assembly protein TadD